jgi:hypothetical protein
MICHYHSVCKWIAIIQCRKRQSVLVQTKYALDVYIVWVIQVCFSLTKTQPFSDIPLCLIIGIEHSTLKCKIDGPSIRENYNRLFGSFHFAELETISQTRLWFGI